MKWSGLSGCGQEVRQSLYWSWAIASLPVLLAVVLPLFAPASAIARITPACVWKTHFGRACPGCGLTTAFLAIGRGDWHGAVAANAAGIPLYFAFASNSLFWLRSILFKRMR